MYKRQPIIPTPSTLRIEWRTEWPRYSFDELVLTAGLGLLLVSAIALPTAAFEPNWRGGILFDDPVREGLRLRSFDQRNSSAIASEVMQWVLIGFPFLVDALASAGIGEGSWDLALQMGLISIEAVLATAYADTITGSADDNFFIGFAGADIIDGGDGGSERGVLGGGVSGGAVGHIVEIDQPLGDGCLLYTSPSPRD